MKRASIRTFETYVMFKWVDFSESTDGIVKTMRLTIKHFLKIIYVCIYIERDILSIYTYIYITII